MGSALQELSRIWWSNYLNPKLSVSPGLPKPKQL